METVAGEMQYLFPYEQGISKLTPKKDNEEISDNSRFNETTLNDADKNKPAPDKSESSFLFQKLQQNTTPNNPEEAIVWLRKLNDSEIGLINRKTLVLEWNELFPEQGEILSGLGWIELELDNQNAAKKWFEQAIRSPGVPKNQNGTGNSVNCKPRLETLNPLSIHSTMHFVMTLIMPMHGAALPILKHDIETTGPRLSRKLNKPFQLNQKMPL